MKVQKYICSSDELGSGEYTAGTREAAGEYFVEDNWTGREGDFVVSVQDEDGGEYEVTVTVEVGHAQFRGKKS